MILGQQGQLDRAEELFRKALAFNPADAGFRINISLAYYLQGKTDEAHMVKLRLDLATARADVPIKSSCYCRLHHAA